MPASLRIDMNADVGEGFGAWRMGDDAPLFEVVTSVNVACGFHAGDPSVMDATVERAARAGVAVGAHPGYFDLRGFGRRPLAADPAEVEADVLYQIGALAAFARARGTRLAHVKPHGALYNQCAAEPDLARAVARAVARFDRGLLLVGLASSACAREAAEAEGLTFAGEAFADRLYKDDGTLAPRSAPGAVILDPEAAAAQAVRLALDGAAATVCVHGDTPSAPAIARAVRRTLEAAGITVLALGH
jgi:UPF0271 protein